jgi:hypothetical protein
MDALSFLEKHGKQVATQVAERAATNYPYFSQIAYGHRRPSVDMAERLVAASAEVVDDPLAQLDLVSLVRPPTRRATAA